MIEHQIFRTPAPGEPMVLAAFSFRHDAHLVPDLIENIRPGVHGIVTWDDRGSAEALSDEMARRQSLLAAARGLGADWLLTPDPDERFERGIADWLPELLAEGDRLLWSFLLHEMFSPTEIRTDGLWGRKTVMRLFPLAAARIDPSRALHGPWVADDSRWVHRTSGIGLYHLRMASPIRRKLRRDLYAAADPARAFQVVGYDYLADERGMVLEPVSVSRGFHPPFSEDHGLWSPDPGQLGPVTPDPYEIGLIRAAISARRQGQLAAHYILEDLFAASPDHGDLRLLSARFACEARAFDQALALADAAMVAQPDAIYPRLLRAQALVGLGRGDAAAIEIDWLQAAVPGSPVIAKLAARAGHTTADLASPHAAWRVVAPEDARMREGPVVARSDLATVVIGFRNQPGLLAAVRSLLEQDEVPEIVVINSGGGDVAAALAPVLDRIRLIACDTPLQVGAARNLGVAASRAPFLAFLAGDCLACPGWVSGRLARHRAGALAVSSAVTGEDEAGPVAMAAHLLHYSTRKPDTPGRFLLHYGQSYARHLLHLCGPFPPGLSATEDTALNRLAARFSAPVWAADVVTLHRDPVTLLALLRDERRRGLRRAGHAPYRDVAAEADPARAMLPALRRRLTLANRMLADEPGLSAAERRSVTATLWLAAQADLHGVTEGLARVRSADGLLSKADDCEQMAARDLAETAWRLDPEDAAKARRVGELRRDCGDAGGALAALRAALALDPADVASARALVALVASRDGPQAAQAEAERLALASPLTQGLWDLAAEQARDDGGGVQWAVALGQIALGCKLEEPAAHTRLAALHAAVPDPVAETFCRFTAARLSAVARARRSHKGTAAPTG